MKQITTLSAESKTALIEASSLVSTGFFSDAPFWIGILLGMILATPMAYLFGRWHEMMIGLREEENE